MKLHQGKPANAWGTNCRRLCTALACLLAFTAAAADSLNWRTNQNSVTADIKAGELTRVLGQVASATGWQVYLEPDITHAVSAKFKDLAPGEALHLLLGDLNFALVPETNSPAKLFVFRTTAAAATQRVIAAKPSPASPKSHLIPNELIVKLKPGAKIDELARALGAKVIGRIDSLNAYRLQFENADAADSARQTLSTNPDVASVDNNYSIDRPAIPAGLNSSGLPPPPQLQLKPPPDTGRVIVGLVDTAVQPLGGNLDQFLLKQISVAGDAQLDPNSPSHGTSMAETILRSVASMTKGSSSFEIQPVDVYGSNPTTSTFQVANGIVLAVNNGAKIINLSLGSDGDSPFLHQIITDAAAQKILFIASAGNQPVTTPVYPAAYPEVNAVTAIDQGQIAPYANRGSFVTLGAPGTSVVYFQGQPYYVMGTSPSAAFITGIVSGYMESTGNGTAQGQTFLKNNFGVKITSAP